MKQNRSTRAILWISILVLIASAISAYLPASGEEALYRDVIRLHVLAESDSERDQATKLNVRDAVLDTVSSLTESATDFDDAYAMLCAAVPDIQAAAEARARECGTSAPVTVEFDRESYPVRYYEDYALPAGEYMSMRVVIGEGAGHNWWCVLFPPMCRTSAVDTSADEEKFFAAGFTPEEYRIIKKESPTKYRVRFKVLELLSETFGFDY